MKHQIYRLTPATKGTGRGGYPQHQKMGENYDRDTPDSLYKLRGDQLPNFRPNLNHIIVRDSSKLTDLISSTPITVHATITSEKLLKILTSFKLPPHKIWSAPVLHKGKKIDGYSVIFIQDPVEHLEYIDFAKSKIWLQEVISHKKLKLLDLKSTRDLKNANKEASQQKEASTTWAEELKLKDKIFDKIDLFTLSTVIYPIGYYVTQNLKNAITEADCTGIEFTNVSENKEDLVDSFDTTRAYTFFL